MDPEIAKTILKKNQVWGLLTSKLDYKARENKTL